MSNEKRPLGIDANERALKETVAASKAATARSVEIATRGVKSGRDFASLMSALMSDLLLGNVDPKIANSVCQVGTRLLKVVEMEHRYGRSAGDKEPPSPTLPLAP